MILFSALVEEGIRRERDGRGGRRWDHCPIGGIRQRLSVDKIENGADMCLQSAEIYLKSILGSGEVHVIEL